MLNEIWKPIVGFEGLYKINNYGEILSLHKRHKGNKVILKQSLKDGYAYVTLYKNKIAHYKRVHRLVLIAFIESNSLKRYCNHKNGIRNDNRLENLEWVTKSENELHAYRILNKKPNILKGENHGNSKLTSKEVNAIRKLCEKGHKKKRLAEWFNIGQRQIYYICNRKSWK